MRNEEGFTLIEVLIAAVILIVGVLSALTVLDSSRKLTLVSERQTSLAHRAQLELERVQSLPYSQVALTGTSASWSTDPTNYTYVGTPVSSCPGNALGPAPTYQPDHKQGGSAATEALVVNGCSYTNTVAGVPTTTAVIGGSITPVQGWQDGNVTGNIYDFVTWTTDPTCNQTTTPGSNCATSNDYKRVTVVVSVTGASQPSQPAVFSGYVTPPNSGHDPIGGVGTTCTNAQGQNGSCSNTGPGTPIQYFPQDCSYTGTCPAGSCQAGICASCPGHNLANTLAAIGTTPPAPDQLGSSPSTGQCPGTPPVPPCDALDVLAGCHHLPIVPTPPSGGGSGCGTPPMDNKKSHAWVTNALAVGSTLKLNGWGGLTTYLKSTSGVDVNATVCLGLYVVPSGVLGVLTGNLLAQPIGAVVSANATATAAVPTPVSFNFNVGQAVNVTSTLLNQVRIEMVIWIAASTSSAIELAYGDPQAGAQLTLMATP